MLEGTIGYGAIYNSIIFEELFFYAIKKILKLRKI